MRTSIMTLLFGTLPAVLSIPTQPILSNTSALPVHFGLLAFNGFQVLDVFGPLDVFATLCSTTITCTSPSSLRPWSPLRQFPENSGDEHDTWRLGEKIVPSTTFKDVLTNVTADIDVLLVPSGSSTRDTMEEGIASVRTLYPKVKHIISVCTGASILARSGILDGRKATINKRAWAWATSIGPKVDWVRTARWVQDGNIWTSSGVSAGINVTYAWVVSTYGENVADYLAFGAEYRRWTNTSDDPLAAVWQ